MLYRLLIVTAAVWGTVGAAKAQDHGISELDDAVARMQYAFYAADTRGVDEALNLVQKVQLPTSMHGMKEYFTAYGQWKLAELYTDEVNAGRRTARAAASKAAGACEHAAQAATRIDGRLAEAHAIEAVCTAVTGRSTGAMALRACAKHKALRAAQELDADNPRIQLIVAQCSGDASGATGATVERLKLVVQTFEAAPPSRPGKPDWGHAEALLMLGQAYLQRGDGTAARDVIEQALVIAPDYRNARSMLEQAATRPR